MTDNGDTITNFFREFYQGENASSTKFILSTTGGGMAAIPWIFSLPGASQCAMEANVPYGQVSLEKAVKKEITSFCSQDTAYTMSTTALEKVAGDFLKEYKDFQMFVKTNFVGIGCTCALVSTEPKKGSHRCHVATASCDGFVTFFYVEFVKGTRSRKEEDWVASAILVDALSAAVTKTHSSLSFSEKYLLEGESVKIASQVEDVDDLFENLLNKKSKYILCLRSEDGGLKFYEDVSLPPGTLVYPGSYNPVHEGHVKLANAAMQFCSEQQQQHLLVFEISVENVDKSALTKEEILRRVNCLYEMVTGFESSYGVVITSAPKFSDKSLYFPLSTFVIGADTLSRILDHRYYGTRFDIVASLSVIKERGCRFIVGGRVDEANSFQNLTTIMESHVEWLPSSLGTTMFREISSFRIDISSTELRLKKNDFLMHKDA